MWKFVLTTIKFMDLSSLPNYEPDDIVELKDTIQTMLHNYKLLFNKFLKPVHHLATHFPSNIENFGPLRYVNCMRYDTNIELCQRKMHKNIKQFKIH